MIKCDSLEKFIRIYTDAVSQPHPVELDNFPDDEAWRVIRTGTPPTGLIYRGSVRRVSICADDCDGYDLGSALPPGFEEVEAWDSAPYRFVWKNDALRAIITYCEGDTDVTVDPDEATYKLRIQSAQFFYEKH